MKTRRIALAGATAALVVAAITLSLGSRAHDVRAREPERKAPEFAGIARWRNSEPLSMAALRGKVVLVEFWTFACSNCVHMLPHVSAWHDAYRKRGLVVVGIHTPETDFEQMDEPLERALARHRIALSRRTGQRPCDVEGLGQPLLAGALPRRPTRQRRVQSLRRG